MLKIPKSSWREKTSQMSPLSPKSFVLFVLFTCLGGNLLGVFYSYLKRKRKYQRKRKSLRMTKKTLGTMGTLGTISQKTSPPVIVKSRLRFWKNPPEVLTFDAIGFVWRCPKMDKILPPFPLILPLHCHDKNSDLLFNF